VAVTGGPIAILGWGSLLWDLDDLASKVEGGWTRGAGPRLPMEFSRVSAKRRMGLVVCLDAAVGVPCATHAIRSRRLRLDEAVADLAARERAAVDRIGWAEAGGRGASRLPPVARTVAAWCARHGWAGAAWTDLEPNFAAHAGRAFSVADGIGYLKGLTGGSLAEAHRYIRNAPPTTRTPLRRALARDAWWRDLSRAGVTEATAGARDPG
jgi:hypothetical protein